jgi:hypothetical protein
LPVAGELSLVSVPKLGDALLKFIVEQPAGVIIEMDGLRRALLRRMGIDRHPPVCESSAQPRRAVRRLGSVARLSQRLAPVPASIPVGRWLTVRACDRWGLAGAGGPAGQVVTELVGNAVQHAGTPIDLVLTYTRPQLHIAVRDRCPRLPRQRTPESVEDHGRGLLVVEAFATGCGAVATRDGKVVWATLSVNVRPVHADPAINARSSR